MTATEPSLAGEAQITAYVGFKDAARAIDFYARAFAAKESFRLTEPSGRIGHAELTIEGAPLMLSDEYPDFGALSAQTLGGSPIKLHLHVADVDSFVQRAVEAGATLLRPVKDEFYGARVGHIADPFGYQWIIASRKEPVSPEELQRRWSAMLEGA